MPLLPEVQLQPHQQRLADEASQGPLRKLLLHSMGSGKGLSSIAASEALGDPYSVVAPASLRANYRTQLEKFTDRTTPVDLLSYSELARGRTPKYPSSLVFDEAAGLRNPGAKQTQSALRAAQNARQVLLLTATPLTNSPGDLSPLVSALTGRNISPEEFTKRYVRQRKVNPSILQRLRGVTPGEETDIAHEDELRALLQGKVDYYAPEKPLVPVQREEHAVEMGTEQTRLYRAIWNKLPWVLRYKLKSQFPLSRDELQKLQSFLSGPRQVGLSTLPYMRKPDPYRAFTQSPKLQKAFDLMRDKLQDERSRGLVFSNFIDAGLKPYASALEREKVPHAVFHGGLSDPQRKQLVDDYNQGRIRVALLGPSGTEGLSFKGTTLLQQLDSHFHGVRGRQAEGRGVRFDSHTHLPPELQNVLVQRFVSRLPPAVSARLWARLTGRPARPEPATDDHLAALSSRKDRLNERFLALLRDVGEHR